MALAPRLRRAAPALAWAAAFAVLPLAAASHDGDGVPDTAEVLVCGHPDLAPLLRDAAPPAPRCVGEDLIADDGGVPPCDACDRQEVLRQEGLKLAPRTGRQVVPVGPYQAPGVQAIAVVEGGYGADGRYCVLVNAFPVCADVPDPVPSLPPLPPTPIGEVPGQTVVGPGLEVPAQPERSIDVLVAYRWYEAALEPRLSAGAHTLYEPVDLADPAALAWWADHAAETSVEFRIVLREDGAATQQHTLNVPFLGQVQAALAKTAG